MTPAFQVDGKNATAPFVLRVHRGEGMALLAMNWKGGPPPRDFVGFAIQYREPGGDRFFDLKNRLGFLNAKGKVDPTQLTTMRSPIQKFRWVHFPRNANMRGTFHYRVTPVFMNRLGELSYGEAQDVDIELYQETYPRHLNVTFTRGFVSSQAFVDRYESKGAISTLLPAKAKEGLAFKPTHPEAKPALEWMGFEARASILKVLDDAIADASAKVSVVAYDLSEPEIVSRLVRLGKRLRILIDDDGAHGEEDSGESQAARKLAKSAGKANVRRQHMGKLQHNKMIVVDGAQAKHAVCGSTNFSWRGLYVQSNNAVIVTGEAAIAPFRDAFENYWASDTPEDFESSNSTAWIDLKVPGVDAKVTFSPHASKTARLTALAEDIGKTKSSLLFSLAFLYQTKGKIRDELKAVRDNDDIFVYGISDKDVGGLDVTKPSGNVAVVSPAALTSNVPQPFSKEPTGGGGTRMHHKFVVIDFDKPTARVYFGSYNFSSAADISNGENLLLIRDQRIATSYAVEALRLFDHYHFRANQVAAEEKDDVLALKRAPAKASEAAWFDDDYKIPYRIRDRELFAGGV